MNMSNKQYEFETQIYKQFMIVAKKVSKIEYGKWQIVPDVSDPLRKFKLVGQLDNLPLTIYPSIKVKYRRKGASDQREFYQGYIYLYHNNRGNFLSKLGPRCSKKLISNINREIPILHERYRLAQEHKERILKEHQKFNESIAMIPGLKVEGEGYQQKVTLANLPPRITINCEQDEVVIDGYMPYEFFKVMCEKMGWGDTPK